MSARLPIAALALSAFLSANAAEPAASLRSGDLAVKLDPAFPGLLECRLGEDTIPGRAATPAGVEINGRLSRCEARFTRLADDRAEYALVFPTEKISLKLRVLLTPGVVELRLADLVESGDTKLKTLAFPGDALLSMSADRAPTLAVSTLDAEYTWGPKDETWMPGGHYKTFSKENIAPVAKLAPGVETVGYAFLSDARVAAAVTSSNYSARKRVETTVAGAAGDRSCSLRHPFWEIRTFDDDTPELGWVKIALAHDLNADGKITWQDAAVALRRTLPRPLGHETVATAVGDCIAMNFASGAQQPFLRILDEIKRMELVTDGLDSRVLIKGFSSEGHDSAKTDYADHWNNRAGGLRDLNTLLSAAKNHHALVGIHINTSEFYPESIRFDPKLFDRAPATGRPRIGWVWLDESIMIDQVKDFREGTAMAALTKMRRDLPGLDFVYVDTFMNNGWPARRLAEQLHGLGLPIGTEMGAALDPWTIWAHSRIGGDIARFLRYSDRDIFSNDPILRGGRTDADGFMGWQNRHDFAGFVKGTFTRNLPAKYLKNFELLAWEPGRSADFSGGVKVVKTGKEVAVTRAGRLVMAWENAGDNTRLLIPWPATRPAKAYAWDETGGERTWDVPAEWNGLTELHLYTLTDLGRTGHTRIPVQNGRVTLRLAPATPYVLHPAEAPAAAPMNWGEGGLVRDPGFAGQSFADWTPSDPARAKIDHDKRGNPRLVLSGADAISVSQPLPGLVAGRTYLAGVWVRTSDARTAALEIRAGDRVFSNRVERCDIPHSAPNDPRTGTTYQHLQLRFTLPADAPSATLALTLAPGAGDAEFDDIRLVESRVSPEAAKHYFHEDFENVDLGGYGPFVGSRAERTHLSEANPPYTKDTIRGKFSLKMREAGPIRTLPSSLRLKPDTRYRVACLTLGEGRLTAETAAGKPLLTLHATPDRQGVSGEFTTGPEDGAYLALRKGKTDFFVIDDLTLDELGAAR